MQFLPATLQRARNFCLAAILALALPACSGESGDTSTTAAGPESALDDTATIDDVKEEAEDLRQTLTSFGADQKAEAQAEIDAAIERVENRFAMLESSIENRWDGLSETARAKAENRLEMLREKKAEFADSYSDVASDTDAAWQRLQNGFADAYAEIDAAFSQAEEEMGLDS